MARAAAKRRPPVRRHDTGRKHKDAGGQRYEDTLFFNRLRKNAKWVFVFLILVFGLGFVLLGVGSGGLNLGDLFNGVGGGSGGPSVSKPLKATQANPNDATAWKDLAAAYDTRGEYTLAVPAWQQYTLLRPRDVDGLNSLAQDYGQQLETQTAAAQAAQIEALQAEPTTFGPPTDSPLGRALGSLSDPLGQSQSTTASTAYQNARSALQQTSGQLVAVYQKIAKLEPTDPGVQLQLASNAETAGNATVAIAAYKRFIKLAPDDATVPQVKAQIKSLEKQLAGSSSTTQG